MAKFRFELEPLLRARRLTEQGHQRAVAAIERDRMSIESGLRTQQQQIEEGKRSMQSQLVGTINIASLRLHAAATVQVMRTAQRTVLELAGLHRRLETARTALIEATKLRRAVELLRERRFEHWRQSQEKLEVDANDELAVIAAARKNSSGELF